MGTILITNPDNIEDPEISRRINILLKRISQAVPNAEMSVTNYNADPVEIVYTFGSVIDANKYATSKDLIDGYHLEHRVVGNIFYELHPVDSLPL